MAYGDRVLRQGLKGDDVVELQLRLAGYRGTLLDGDFGSGTELQVKCFQRDCMGLSTPSGVVDRATFLAIDELASRFPIDFAQLRCPCGVCGGFGQGRFKGRYMPGGEGQEKFHRYEYPGIHRLILWAARALFAYREDIRFSFSSGYRCAVENERKGRTTTNHHGKAVDIDTVLAPGMGKREDLERCDELRRLLVEKSNAQIGWLGRNRKSLEPSDIAPTWVHYDVREYESKYLRDDFFCRDLAGLDRRLPITV